MGQRIVGGHVEDDDDVGNGGEGEGEVREERRQCVARQGGC